MSGRGITMSTPPSLTPRQGNRHGPAQQPSRTHDLIIVDGFPDMSPASPRSAQHSLDQYRQNSAAASLGTLDPATRRASPWIESSSLNMGYSMGGDGRIA